jgi:hypothetical protein
MAFCGYIDYTLLCNAIPITEEDKIPEVYNFREPIFHDDPTAEEGSETPMGMIGEVYADIGYQMVIFMNRSPLFARQVIEQFPSRPLKAMGLLLYEKVLKPELMSHKNLNAETSAAKCAPPTLDGTKDLKTDPVDRRNLEYVDKRLDIPSNHVPSLAQ